MSFYCLLVHYIYLNPGLLPLLKSIIMHALHLIFLSVLSHFSLNLQIYAPILSHFSVPLRRANLCMPIFPYYFFPVQFLSSPSFLRIPKYATILPTTTKIFLSEMNTIETCQCISILATIRLKSRVEPTPET